MALQLHSTKLTYEDYLLFPDDGKRHELIDGAHFMTPSPIEKHQRISMRLSFLLSAYLATHPVGHLYHAPFDVVLSDFDIVEPDLVFVSLPRAAIITEKHIRGAPDLVVEILSESTRKTDETVKRKLYERHGVSEYWIVDPEVETVKIYRTTDQGYIRAAELDRESDDAISTPLLPDFSIPLAEIFR